MTKTVLVTDARLGSALTIIRSLGRKGYRVIAADALHNVIGFRSRYTSESFVYPAPEEDPEAFINTIYQRVKQDKIDLIIPATDAAILPLSSVRERFDGVCQIAMPTPTALDIVTNKLKTLSLAKEQRVPIPTTHLLSTTDDAINIMHELQWPVVLKPIRSRLYSKDEGVKAFEVTYAGDPESLIKRMRVFEGYCDILLQTYYPGEGHGVELLLHKGQPLYAFQHKRLHEVPITGGASSLRESVPLDPKLYDYAVRMLKTLDWTGLAMVEFKLAADGPKLMEINGRVWGSLPLAVHSGMDFPGHLVDLYFNSPTTIPSNPDTRYRTGVRARNLNLDVIWWLSVLRGDKRHPALTTPSRFELIPSALSYLNPFYKTDVQSWNDPLPGLLELPQIIQKVFRKALGRPT